MIEFPYSLFSDTENFPIHLQYGYHEKSLYVHSHLDFSELVIVLDGCADHLVNGKSYGIAKGDVFVINSQTEHGFFQPEKLKICNIMFQPEAIFQDIHDMKQMPGFQALFVLEPHYTQNSGFHNQLKLKADAFQIVAHMLNELMTEYQNRNPGWKDFVCADFRKLCILLSRFYRTENPSDRNNVYNLAGTVAYIENHFSQPITMEELSHTSGYSDRQLIRIFQSAFGMTPSAYVTKLRLQKAKQLLESTDLSIGEVAWSCGFDDPNYFSRFFRKNTGASPKEYQTIFQKKKGSI